MLVYLLAWTLMIPIAIANGLLREKVLRMRLSELRAHQISTLTGILFFGLFAALLSRFFPLESWREAALTGGAWCGMTVAFEFLFGHFIAGHSWTRLLQDYDLRAGRIWPLVLLWLAIAPMMFHALWRGLP